MNNASPLRNEEEHIEALALTRGHERFLAAQENVRRNEGSFATYGASKLIKGSIPLVSAAVSSFLSSQVGRAGRTHVAHSILKQFDPDALAFIALNMTFEGTARDLHITKVTKAIGNTLQAECVAGALQEQLDQKAQDRIRGRVRRQGNYKMRGKVFDRLVRDNGVEWEDWTADMLLKVGEPLLNAVLSALPSIFELVTRTVNKRSLVYVQLTQDGAQMVLNLTEAAAWMKPMHQPMLTIPRPWTSFDTGCYYDERVARTVRLVRTFNKDHRKLVRDAIAAGTMAPCLEALNALQETAWAINTPVYDLVRWAWQEGQTPGEFPKAKSLEVPSRIPDDAWSTYSDAMKKGHRLAISSVITRNRAIVSDASIMLRDLTTAQDLSRYERFYLPHNLDFRGRVYPVCHFNHQRTDHVKAMFRFAEGKPLGPHGGTWLAIHLANCGDFNKLSKASFDDRCAWVTENSDLLVRIGRDPRLLFAEWAQADSPFCFVAACIEYAAWADTGFSPDFVSHLAVALDGSNSGLQHYAAALRSEEGALVGLKASHKPSDVYRVVADTLAPQVAVDALQGDPRAILMQRAGVTRGTVKRPVMTFAYSSEQFGFRQQLLSDLMRPLCDKGLSDPTFVHPYELPREDGSGDGGFACSGYLAAGIWRAVTTVVKDATEGMAFFKTVAGILAAEDKPLVWTSPIGLPVMHKYVEWETKQVKLWLFDKAVLVTQATPDDRLDGDSVLRRVRANLRTEPTSKIDRDKAKSAVAPNVIHSQDASHLMLTVLDAKDAGIKDFALIHDSFGTHAGSTQEFFYIIRQAFVNMYENYCPFEAVRDAAMAVLTPEGRERLPDLPKKGGLNLEEVLDSLYAFA